VLLLHFRWLLNVSHSLVTYKQVLNGHKVPRHVDRPATCFSSCYDATLAYKLLAKLKETV